MRVALYARYSSDKQRAASIDDQLRDSRKFAEAQGWTVVAEYQDGARSGDSLLRPGIQSLLSHARAKKFDLVLAEAQDRFARALADIASLHRHLTFNRVEMWTISGGRVTPMHVAFQGTIDAQYLERLRDETRRGMRGRVLDGKSAGLGATATASCRSQAPRRASAAVAKSSPSKRRSSDASSASSSQVARRRRSRKR
jgi:site-specific DNA recombinase